MSCHNMGGGHSKKRIIAIISGAAIAAIGIAYVSLAANPVAAAAVISAILVFAACPAICAAMRGAMWLSRRFKKRNNNNNIIQTQSLNNNVNELVTKNLGVESHSGGDNNNEMVQVRL